MGQSDTENCPYTIQIQHKQRYQGQYLAKKIGLHYNTFMYCAPDMGHFIQPDLIGFLGGIKFYRFALNGSTWIDAWGSYSLVNSVNWKGLNS